MARRFFISPEFICNKEARLPDAEARHLKNVLRIREGEKVEIFNGKGGVWHGAVEFRHGEVFVCGLTQIHSPQTSSARLMLAMSMIKPTRFEWAIEKSTELGVDVIIPLYTVRSEIRISDEKISGRLARWERIAKEASKQCRRPNVPVMRPPLEFRDFLSSEEYSIQDRILFYEKSDNQWLPDRTETAGDTTICIGPEGGWTEDEVESAEKSGCAVVGLGPWVLRAETAAITVISILMFRKH